MPDPERPSPALPKGKILVVDDEADIRESLQALLEMEGYVVDLAASGAEGLRAVEARDYDLMLLDLMMPDLSGMEVLQEVRSHDRDLPVFLITAYGSTQVAVDALKAGASDYFPKPWETTSCCWRSSASSPSTGWNARTRSSSAPSSSATVFPTSWARASGWCAFWTW